ncbi:MAG: hypothetical protein HRF50_02490 [Phycisphaerae bacterium]
MSTLRTRISAAFEWTQHGALAAALLLAAPAAAQYAVSQDGRLFDANPQVGGNRYNYARPASPLLGGNYYATGDVRGGFALQSYSPIPGSSAFRGPLGSGALGSFIRDSVGIAEARSPGGLSRGPYYDPVLSAPSGSYLAGYGEYGSRPGAAGFAPSVPPTNFGAVSGFSGSGGPLSTPLDLRLSGQSPAGVIPLARPPGADGGLRSWIFGPAPRINYGPQPAEFSASLDRPYRIAGLDNEAPAMPAPKTLSTSSEGRVEWGPLDLRLPVLPGQSEAQAKRASPVDLLIQGQSEALLTRSANAQLRARRLNLPGDDAAVQPADAGAPLAGDVQAPTLKDLGLAPGSDVFNDLRLALSLSSDPSARWFQELQRGSTDARLAVQGAQEQIAQESQEFVQRMFAAPIRSFVGSDANALNDELLKAEAFMEIGEYFDAANRYERATRLAPGNPLPVIGRGHAALAAGDYLSAAVHLLRGLEMFPQIAGFRVDLTRLLGGGEIVDIRRSDIMKQLERHEDPRLRFLLGYIEVHSGNTGQGLENLEQAALSGQLGPAVQRYYGILRTQSSDAAPSVNIPTSEPAAPADDPPPP